MIDPKKAGLSVYSDAPPSGPHGHMERERDPLTAFLSAPAIKKAREVDPLSDADACALLVKFANDGALSAREWARFMGDRAPTGTTLPTIISIVRDQLGQLVDYRERASEFLGPWWANELEGRAALLPVARFVGGSFVLEQRPICKEPFAACAYAMCLLLDQSRSFGRELWRCQFEECGNFFFEYRSRPKAKPNRTHCSEKCRVNARRVYVGEAVKKSRAEKKRKAIKRRAS